MVGNKSPLSTGHTSSRTSPPAKKCLNQLERWGERERKIERERKTGQNTGCKRKDKWMTCCSGIYVFKNVFKRKIIVPWALLRCYLKSCKLKYITLDCMSSVSKVVEQQVVIIDPDPGYRVCAQLCISYVCRCVEKWTWVDSNKI